MIKIKKILTLLLIIFIHIRPIYSTEQILKVGYINPETTTFWDQVSNMMIVCAKNLNIKLEIYQGDIRSVHKVVKQITNNIGSKPQYMIFNYHIGGKTTEHIEKFQDVGIKSLIINTDIPSKERALMGKPRELFSNWIGHIYPDDKAAGKNLAKALIEKARLSNSYMINKKIHLVALGGARYTTAGTYRNQGLEEYIHSQTDVVLKGLYWTNWEVNDIPRIIKGVTQKYPNVTVFWTAYDDAAIKVSETLRSMNKIPGKDFFTGGIDWSHKGINAIKNKEIVTSFGGHFMEGMIALLMIYDYHNGHDFKTLIGLVSKTKMQKIDIKMIKLLKKLTKFELLSKIDFKKFTKTHNPNIKNYNLSLEKLFQ